MSIWDHPAIKGCMNMMEREGLFDPDLGKSRDFFMEARKLRAQLGFPMEGLVSRFLSTKPDRYDPADISQFHRLEIMCAFFDNLHGLMSPDESTRRHFERRVQDVMGGRLPNKKDITMSEQFRRHHQATLEKTHSRSRAGVYFEL